MCLQIKNLGKKSNILQNESQKFTQFAENVENIHF